MHPLGGDAAGEYDPRVPAVIGHGSLPKDGIIRHLHGPGIDLGKIVHDMRRDADDCIQPPADGGLIRLIQTVHDPAQGLWEPVLFQDGLSSKLMAVEYDHLPAALEPQSIWQQLRVMEMVDLGVQCQRLPVYPAGKEQHPEKTAA